MSVKVQTTLSDAEFAAFQAKFGTRTQTQAVHDACVSWQPAAPPPPPPPPEVYEVRVTSATGDSSTGRVAIAGTAASTVKNVVVAQAGIKVGEVAPVSGSWAVSVPTTENPTSLTAQGWDSLPGQPGTATPSVTFPVAWSAPVPPPAGQVTNRVFGASTPVPMTTQYLDALKASGASPDGPPMVRLDLDWWTVEPSQGAALNWSALDPFVDAAVARGIRVLLILGYCPPWANGGYRDDTGNLSDKAFPTNDSQWSSIIDRTVRHFGTKVAAYEVWNEPNNIGDFAWYATDPKVRYWQLVRLAHQTVKGIDASRHVVAGASGIGYTTANRSDVWLGWAYANGYKPYFDAVPIHGYTSFNSGLSYTYVPPPEYLFWNMLGLDDPTKGMTAAVRKVMVDNGDSAKKIWNTEWGYPSPNSAGVPAATVALWEVEAIHMWRARTYTGPSFRYMLVDRKAGSGVDDDNQGLLSASFGPKEPIYTAVKNAVAGP